MALTKKTILEFENPTEKTSGLVNGNDTYYLNAMLVFDGSTGYLTVPSDAAALEVAGVYDGNNDDGVDNEYVVASGQHPRVGLKLGKVWIPFSGAAQTDVGDIMYVADDETLTKTAGSKTIGYRALDFKTGFIQIDLRKPIKLS